MGKQIKVRATRHGVYGQYRHPGDVFYIDQEEDYSDGWMERIEEGEAVSPAPELPRSAFVFTDEQEAIRHYTVDEMAADPAKRDQMVELMKLVYPEGPEAMIQHLDDTIAAYKSGQEVQ